MKTKYWKLLAQRFELGELLSEPQRVEGGRLNALWKVEFKQGIFAVKIINPFYANQPKALEHYEESEAFTRVCKKQQIPTQLALTSNDYSYVSIEDQLSVVFPWIEGTPLKADQISLAQITHIGTLLRKIHQVGKSFNKVRAELFTRTQPIDWILLIPVLNNIVVSQGKTFEWIKDLENEAEKNRLFLGKEMVMSHRDLLPPNIIWRGAGQDFTVIDWEYSGLTNPRLELVSTAFNWSVKEDFTLNESFFKTLIHAYYKNARFENSDFSAEFWGLVFIVLDWLAFNLESLMRSSIGPREKKILIEEIQKTWQNLHTLLNAKPLFGP